MAFACGMTSRANSSLRTVCNKVLRHDLDKSDDSGRESKWSQGKLTEQQFTYAARDALAGRLIFEKLTQAGGDIPASEDHDVDLVSPAGTEELRDATYETTITRVKLDSWHAMKRIKSPRHHPF